ncbi:response regulator transcription factor [Paenibacillus sp. 1P07SE]|uniref:response regulator transcription factor n=1 Tax=Paenibacillus sp. 1P07SE TaxID=3132209 RepID=UPI0039A6289E
MVRLLIADDDDYTREGLVETLPWASLGISEVLQARDGMEAIRIAASERPEVVLTDIRMPRLNGIAFAEKLVRLCPDSRLLFMSGYMDVDYLRSAIKLSAVDFIEKPLKLQEVEQAIVKAIHQLETHQQQDSIKEEKVALQRRQLAALLLRGAERERMAKLCRETGFPADQAYTVVVLRELFPFNGEAGKHDLAAGFWREHGCEVIMHDEENGQTELIVAYDAKAGRRIDYLMSAFAVEFLDAVTGIGQTASDLEGVSRSGETARQAAALAFYAPEQRCFRYDDGERVEDERLPSLLPELYRLIRDHQEQLPHWFGELCDGFAKRRSPMPDRVADSCASLAEALLEGCVLLREQPEYSDPYTSLRACMTLADVRSYMCQLAERYVAEAERLSGYSRLVQEVIRYVALHYSRADLELAEIAGVVHLSSAHLSVLFKQETGHTIKQYISDYRIEAARKLIASGHCRMQEVAGRCGYASASYFAKAFKAATGYSPVEYKKAQES